VREARHGPIVALVAIPCRGAARLASPAEICVQPSI
jgi:hypothetical protein